LITFLRKRLQTSENSPMMLNRTFSELNGFMDAFICISISQFKVLWSILFSLDLNTDELWAELKVIAFWSKLTFRNFHFLIFFSKKFSIYWCLDKWWVCIQCPTHEIEYPIYYSVVDSFVICVALYWIKIRFILFKPCAYLLKTYY
jgi:hypothetical protein